MEIARRKMDKAKPNPDTESALSSLRKELTRMFEPRLNGSASGRELIMFYPLEVKSKAVGKLSVLAVRQKISVHS